MNKLFMLAVFALCFTGLSAQESEQGSAQEPDKEVAESNAAVDTTSDVAAESNVEGADTEGSN